MIFAGIVNSEGALWKDQRRFLHSKFRSLGASYMGAGKKIMESRIMVSTRQFFPFFKVKIAEIAPKKCSKFKFEKI